MNCISKLPVRLFDLQQAGKRERAFPVIEGVAALAQQQFESDVGFSQIQSISTSPFSEPYIEIMAVILHYRHTVFAYLVIKLIIDPDQPVMRVTNGEFTDSAFQVALSLEVFNAFHTTPFDTGNPNAMRR
jgi:hypothetical protein